VNNTGTKKGRIMK